MHRSPGPQPDSSCQWGPCTGWSSCCRAEVALRALLPPRDPTFHPVQDRISLSSGVIGPCPSGTAAGPVSSSPCPATGTASWSSLSLSLVGCLVLRAGVPQAACCWQGRWDRAWLPGSAAVSSTTIGTIQKGGSCQQPVRQQKHPGTILAEENRKSSWSCCKALTATSMAFIYFCECPYMQPLPCKGYISLQTAQFLLLAGNFLDISEGLFNYGLLDMAIPVVMVRGAWAGTPT